MKKILAIGLLITLFLFSGNLVLAENVVEKPQEVESKKLEREAKILSSYLSQFDSPLQYYAQDFIDAAKTYNLDWKLLPAIAGVESTFGKFIPGGYNAWGWGVYGNQAIYFNSWKDGIFTVSKGLRENYLDKGLTDPYSINRMYAESRSWGSKVTYFMQDLDKFAQNFEDKNQVVKMDSSVKIAAISGQLEVK